MMMWMSAFDNILMVRAVQNPFFPFCIGTFKSTVQTAEQYSSYMPSSELYNSDMAKALWKVLLWTIFLSFSPL